jgi:hypothetical protein
VPPLHPTITVFNVLDRDKYHNLIGNIFESAN